jgi:hypothetical protein
VKLAGLDSHGEDLSLDNDRALGGRNGGRGLHGVLGLPQLLLRLAFDAAGDRVDLADA